jgi:hypothetical protein
MEDSYQLVLARLKKLGILLASDPNLPSVCTLITGEPLKSSWRSHPLAQTIFQVNERLEDHADVLITKLLSGKVTFVHRKLWPELFAIGTARETWQLDSLSPSARALLKIIDDCGTLRTDKLKASSKMKPADAARELERRLLIQAAQVHTGSGAHAKNLETWEHWSKRVGFVATPITSAEGMRKMEARVRRINLEFNAKSRLPWQANASLQNPRAGSARMQNLTSILN